MTDVSFNKIKSKTSQIAKPAKEELEKYQTSARKQIVGDYGDKGASSDIQARSDVSPIVEAMTQSSNGTQQITDSQKKQKQRQFIKLQEEEEEELKKKRRQREELEEEKRRIRDPQAEEKENIVQPGEPILPTSKHPRGLPIGVRQKQTHVESKLGKD